MSHWPLLSLVTFLPLVGVAFIMIRAARRRWSPATRALSRCGRRSIVFALSVVLWVEFDPSTAAFPVRRAGELDQSRRLHDHLSHGDRRHLAVLHPALDPADPALDHLQLGHYPGQGQGIHDRLPRPRNLDGRHVLRARFYPVLRVFRGRADPDVPDHRHLGRGKPGLCRVQVLSLYVARLGVDAAGDPGGLHPDRDRPTSRWR